MGFFMHYNRPGHSWCCPASCQIIYVVLSRKWHVFVRSREWRAVGGDPGQGNTGSRQLPLGSWWCTSEGPLSVVGHSGDTGATREKLRAVLILKATVWSSTYNCSGKTFVLPGSITSFAFFSSYKIVLGLNFNKTSFSYSGSCFNM